MRAALALGLCLLGLTLALNRLGERAPLPRAAGARADGGLDLILASTPPLAPPGRLGNRELFEAALVGDRVLVPEEGERGLMVVTLGPGLEFEARDVFDPRSAEEAGRLEEALRTARPGTVVALVHLRAGASDAAAGGSWPQLLRSLGAADLPWAPRHAGWALVSARLRDGWRALAEGHAVDAGVVLPFALAPDVASYRERRPERWRPAPDPTRALHLDRELEAATLLEGVEHVPTAVAGEFPRAGLLFAPGPNRPARLSLPSLELGPGASLVTWLGFPDGALPSTDGATCELEVDGAVVARRYLPAGTRGWVPWRVPLGNAAGRRELVLVTRPGPEARGDTLVWAEPRLFPGIP